MARNRKLRWCLLAVVVVVAAGIVAPASFGVYPPDEGGSIWVCGNSGTTPEWSSINELYSPVCLSNQTAFYGYKPNAGTFCEAAGYRAQVWHVDDASNYYQRFDAFWCLDGLFHWSGAWGYSERRFSWMRTGAGVDWAMHQYRNP
jgi:hypothetical protein